MRKSIVLVAGTCALSGICLALAIAVSTKAQPPDGNNRDWPALAIPDQHRPGMPGRLWEAIANTKRLEAAYYEAVESNRKQPGTVSDAEVDRLHRAYSDILLSVTSKQVTLLQAEVDGLRKAFQDSKRVRIQPLAP